MKYITACIFALLLAMSLVVNVNAQAAETIWLSASTQSYKRGETVTATVNAVSATPIQGFTFQIRYDPGCLEPLNAASPISSMNGLLLPQSAGLVDATFASTTPQTANGVLAEVRFVALAGCQTNLVLETAALAIRNEAGFAAPLTSVTVGEQNVALNIDNAAGESQALQPPVGPPLSLAVEAPSRPSPISGALIVLAVIVFTVILFGIYKLFQKRTQKRTAALEKT